MSLRSVNLNLLPILRALLCERSVARAGESLGLSRSATSDALGRLRKLLGDALLIQVGRSMQLTPFAMGLIEPVEQLCRDLDSVLRRPVFDPKTTQRVFRVAAVDYQAFNAINTIAEILRVRAPGLQTQFFDLTRDAAGRLKSGELDLVISAIEFFSPQDAGQLHTSMLPEDRLVAVFGAHHPLAAKAVLSEGELRRYPHVMFHPGVEWQHFEHTIMPKNLRTTIHVQQVISLPLIALRTDHVTIVPRALALEMAALLPLQIRALPGRPRKVEVCVAWARVQHKDPAHKWFRQVLMDGLKGKKAV